MAIRIGWPKWTGILNNEPPKSPWGSGGGGNGGSGGGGGSGDGGPRNPWSFPPQGKRPRPAGGGPLDELLKRARTGRGSGGGGGFPGFPVGNRVWLFGLAALAALWFVLTSIHVIGPQERGVITTLGRYSGTIDPGFSITLPAPISSVAAVDVQAIRDETFPQGGGTAENLMLTGDQNIVDLAYLVQWRVRDPVGFVYQIANPQETVRATAETAMRAIVATATLNDTITSGRAAIEARVQVMMQQILDEYRSGIIVQSVSIQKAAAPQAVDEDFKQVTAAQQQAQANKNNANAYAQQVLATAQGEAAEFDKLYEQYALAPEVTRRRLYYETMEAVLARSNKTIVEAPGVTPYLALPQLQKKAEEATTPEAQPKGATR